MLSSYIEIYDFDCHEETGLKCLAMLMSYIAAQACSI